MVHLIVVAILIIVMAVLTYFGLTSAGLMPVEASLQSISIDQLWNLQVIAMSFLFALIVVPLFYSLIVFRRKKGDTTDAEHIEGNTPLEITWTVLPLIAVLTFAFLGAKSLGETRRVDPQAMVINVTAQQFAWSFQYPDYGVTTKELYLPVGKQVILKMQSRDVIHSFWVPEFRVKQDVVPGRVTEYRITPSLEGGYKVRCAELCGASHSYMLAQIEVVPQGRFDSWISDQQAAAAAAGSTPEARGQALAAQFGCQGCHSLDGSILVGPSWKGLYGSQVQLEDGSTVTADDAYIKQSILEPASQVVKGFPPMSFNGTDAGITEQQIADIIAFIKTLK